MPKDPYSPVLAGLAEGKRIEMFVGGVWVAATRADALNATAAASMPTTSFRVKPDMAMVAPHEVPYCVRVAPANLSTYYTPVLCVNLAGAAGTTACTWLGNADDLYRLANGLVFLTAADALAAALATNEALKKASV